MWFGYELSKRYTKSDSIIFLDHYVLILVLSATSTCWFFFFVVQKCKPIEARTERIAKETVFCLKKKIAGLENIMDKEQYWNNIHGSVTLYLVNVKIVPLGARKRINMIKNNEQSSNYRADWYQYLHVKYFQFHWI